MAWGNIKLNDGTEIPNIAFGTGSAGSGQPATDQVEQALGLGFDHLDTAQLYRNEAETGQALKGSGVSRSGLYITTKYSGFKDVDTSIQDSLDYLGVSYVDLYLIHSPGLAKGDIPGLWKQIEQVQARGLAKSVGVSNFDVADLDILLKDAKVKPTVNQIMFHPYNQAEQLPTVEYCIKQDIVIQAYSPLIPVTKQAGGPLDKPLASIGARLGATPDQILLAWSKAKGNVVVTTSSKKDRLESYTKAGDLELTAQDIHDLDTAGGSEQ